MDQQTKKKCLEMENSQRTTRKYLKPKWKHEKRIIKVFEEFIVVVVDVVFFCSKAKNLKLGFNKN